MSSDEITLDYPGWGAKSNDKRPCKRQKGRCRQRRSHVKAEAEVRGTQPQAKKSLEHQTLEEARKRISPGTSGGEGGGHRRRTRAGRTENSDCRHVELALLSPSRRSSPKHAQHPRPACRRHSPLPGSLGPALHARTGIPTGKGFLPQGRRPPAGDSPPELSTRLYSICNSCL